MIKWGTLFWVSTTRTTVVFLSGSTTVEYLNRHINSKYTNWWLWCAPKVSMYGHILCCLGAQKLLTGMAHGLFVFSVVYKRVHSESPWEILGRHYVSTCSCQHAAIITLSSYKHVLVSVLTSWLESHPVWLSLYTCRWLYTESKVLSQVWCWHIYLQNVSCYNSDRAENLLLSCSSTSL